MSRYVFTVGATVTAGGQTLTYRKGDVAELTSAQATAAGSAIRAVRAASSNLSDQDGEAFAAANSS